MKTKFIVLIMRLALAAVVTTILQVHAAESDTTCTPEENKSPPWLLKMDISQAKQYTSQQWYGDWLLTTTSLCTDLTRLAADNPKFRQILWRNDREPLFRGGYERTPEDIFQNGFYPWNSTATGTLSIPSHANNTASALTNTGYQPQYTFLLGVHRYVIDAPGGIDASGSDNDNGKPGHNVVVFPGGIRRERIKGVFFKENQQLVWQPNPNYAFGQPASDEFDIVATPWDPKNAENFSNARITVDPKGEDIGWIGHRYKKGTDVTLLLENGQNDECWYVNGVKKEGGERFLFTSANQLSAVSVVYRGSC